VIKKGLKTPLIPEAFWFCGFILFGRFVSKDPFPIPLYKCYFFDPGGSGMAGSQEFC